MTSKVRDKLENKEMEEKGDSKISGKFKERHVILKGQKPMLSLYNCICLIKLLFLGWLTTDQQDN